MEALETLSLLQEHYVEGLSPMRTPVRVGGFLALFHPDDPIFFANMACPVDSLGDGDVADLVSQYRSRARVPWLEFAMELWPDVPAKLEAAGLVLKHRIPVMVIHRNEW